MYCGQMVEVGTRDQILGIPSPPLYGCLLKSIPDFDKLVRHKSRLETLPGGDTAAAASAHRLPPRPTLPLRPEAVRADAADEQGQGASVQLLLPLNMEEPKK